MTSQDRPLTRRELRERERLLEQQAASATQQADAPAPAFPVSPPPQAAPAFPAQPPAAPASAPAPTSAPTADAAPDASPAPAFAPRSAGVASAAGSPFAGPVAAPAPQAEDAPEAPDPSPFAPRATPQPWSRQAAAVDDDDEPTPERTLTRRELRALIDATQLDEYDDELDDDPDDVARPAGATGAAKAAPPRTTTPHDARPGEQGLDPAVAAKPVGHWTSQLDLPEEQPEPFDQLLARAGGGSHGVPTTTSALILPSMPSQGGIGQPLPDGGEIIVTGSIDLPRSFGATGLHPGQLDSSDVDRLIDHVEDAGGGGAAPVSASRAISTQGHPRDMIAPPKKEGVNAPLVLAVTAGVLALGVVASLVVGAMVGLF